MNHRWEKTDGAHGAGTLVMGYEYCDAYGTSRYDRAGNRLIAYHTHDPVCQELHCK